MWILYGPGEEMYTVMFWEVVLFFFIVFELFHKKLQSYKSSQ